MAAKEKKAIEKEQKQEDIERRKIEKLKKETKEEKKKKIIIKILLCHAKTDAISKWFRIVGSCDPLESRACAPFRRLLSLAK
jgi:hypothetical protein